MKKAKYLCLLSLILALPASAENIVLSENIELSEVLFLVSLSRSAGICDQFKNQIAFAQEAKFEGASKPIISYWTIEAAKSGLSFEQYTESCVKILDEYKKAQLAHPN